MDPLTHSLSGAILSRTGFYQRFGRMATIILVAAAIIPDIDHLTLRLAGPLAYLKYHRGFTHSIFGGFVVAAIMAGIVCSIKRFREKLGYLITFGLFLLGIYTHIFLDLITSYGTQILFPFSGKRYSLDLVFIIDLYFTALMLIPLIVIRFKRKWAKAIALISVAGIIIYLGVAYAGRTIAIESANAWAHKLGIISKKVEALPLPFSPFRWSVYIEDDKRFYQVDVDALKNSATFNSFEKKHVPEGLNQETEGNNIIEKVENLEIVKTYLWFARFPVVSIKKETEGYSVEYFDLRFNSLPPRRPFLLKLFVDRNGTLNNAELMFHTTK
ncbi:MAG: metal-dependent hydrolase [Deltaproteobacteria bacterium]|nr:metal-dependent hydrolase [Deltaproteobacteria bacterium]